VGAEETQEGDAEEGVMAEGKEPHPELAGVESGLEGVEVVVGSAGTGPSASFGHRFLPGFGWLDEW